MHVFLVFFFHKVLFSVFISSCHESEFLCFQYTEGAMSDLDLLIIGGYYGEGRRRGFVSQFLLGVAVPSESLGNRVNLVKVNRLLKLNLMCVKI